jgi:hypothetical protein
MSAAFLNTVLPSSVPGRRVQVAPSGPVAVNGGGTFEVMSNNTQSRVVEQQSTNNARVHTVPALGHHLTTRRFERQARQQRASNAMLLNRSLILIFAFVVMLGVAKVVMWLVKENIIDTSHLTLFMILLFILGLWKQSTNVARTNSMNTEFWSTRALGPENNRSRAQRMETPREAFMRECMEVDPTDNDPTMAALNSKGMVKVDTRQPSVVVEGLTLPTTTVSSNPLAAGNTDASSAVYSPPIVVHRPDALPGGSTADPAIVIAGRVNS